MSVASGDCEQELLIGPFIFFFYSFWRRRKFAFEFVRFISINKNLFKKYSDFLICRLPFVVWVAISYYIYLWTLLRSSQSHFSLNFWKIILFSLFWSDPPTSRHHLLLPELWTFLSVKCPPRSLCLRSERLSASPYRGPWSDSDRRPTISPPLIWPWSWCPAQPSALPRPTTLSGTPASTTQRPSIHTAPPRQLTDAQLGAKAGFGTQ